MIPDDPQLQAFLDRLEVETNASNRRDLLNTLFAALVGAALAYWAYGTVAHTLLFGYVVFAVSAVANRVTGEMRSQAAREEGRRLVDEHFDR